MKPLSEICKQGCLPSDTHMHSCTHTKYCIEVSIYYLYINMRHNKGSWHIGWHDLYSENLFISYIIFLYLFRYPHRSVPCPALATEESYQASMKCRNDIKWWLPNALCSIWKEECKVTGSDLFMSAQLSEYLSLEARSVANWISSSDESRVSKRAI